MALGDNCRSGCRTKDHASWGDCARASRVRVAWLESTNGLSRAADKAFDKDMSSYEQARKDGIQPAATTAQAVQEAYRVSEMTGTAYDGGTMPPTALIPNKNVATAAQEAGQL